MIGELVKHDIGSLAGYLNPWDLDGEQYQTWQVVYMIMDQLHLM